MSFGILPSTKIQSAAKKWALSFISNRYGSPFNNYFHNNYICLTYNCILIWLVFFLAPKQRKKKNLMQILYYMVLAECISWTRCIIYVLSESIWLSDFCQLLDYARRIVIMICIKLLIALLNSVLWIWRGSYRLCVLYWLTSFNDILDYFAIMRTVI